MSVPIHSGHFKVFASINEETQWVASRRPRSWAASIGVDSKICAALPDKKVSRSLLKDICEDSSFSSEQCFLAIMAWGGMKVGHGRLAWAARGNWVEIVRSLRKGEITRLDAYDQFKRFREQNPGCGIGPAYYTKIIFFAHPRHDGYIMDQWTALSINLLVSKEQSLRAGIVEMTSGMVQRRQYDAVNDRNTGGGYERFCGIIEQIALRLKISPEDVEKRLFSEGGRQPGAWRKYVKDNRPKVHS